MARSPHSTSYSASSFAPTASQRRKLASKPPIVDAQGLQKLLAELDADKQRKRNAEIMTSPQGICASSPPSAGYGSGGYASGGYGSGGYGSGGYGLGGYGSGGYGSGGYGSGGHGSSPPAGYCGSPSCGRYGGWRGSSPLGGGGGGGSGDYVRGGYSSGGYSSGGYSSGGHGGVGGVSLALPSGGGMCVISRREGGAGAHSSAYPSAAGHGSAGGAGSPLAQSPFESPVATTSVPAVRRRTDTGSGNKFQRAMYIPEVGDRQEDPKAISRRSADLLRLLKVVSHEGARSPLVSWRNHLRIWLAAAILQPLAALLEDNGARVKTAAAKGLAAAATAPGGFGSGALGGGSNQFSSSLFAPRPVAAVPSSLLGASPAAPGAPVSITQWLQHAHADEASQALAQQHKHLARFLLPAGSFALDACHAYCRHRILELAQGGCMAQYQWDGGSTNGGDSTTGSTTSAHRWCATLPTDAQILVHVVCCYFDAMLPPLASAAAAPAPAPAAGAFGCGFGGGFGRGALGGQGFGTTGGLDLGASSSFLGAAGPASAAPGAPGALGAGSSKTSVFWRPPEELCAFRTLHYSMDTEPQQRKSDFVLLQRAGHGNGSGNTKQSPPRFSLLCDGVEWVVAQGEHNAFDTLLLLLLHRAKHHGFLGGLDLKEETFGLLMKTLCAPGAAPAPKPQSLTTYHGIMSVLRPWSRELEDLELKEVTKALSG